MAEATLSGEEFISRPSATLPAMSHLPAAAPPVTYAADDASTTTEYGRGPSDRAPVGAKMGHRGQLRAGTVEADPVGRSAGVPVGVVRVDDAAEPHRERAVSASR